MFSPDLDEVEALELDLDALGDVLKGLLGRHDGFLGLLDLLLSLGKLVGLVGRLDLGVVLALLLQRALGALPRLERLHTLLEARLRNTNENKKKKRKKKEGKIRSLDAESRLMAIPGRTRMAPIRPM